MTDGELFYKVDVAAAALVGAGAGTSVEVAYALIQNGIVQLLRKSVTPDHLSEVLAAATNIATKIVREVPDAECEQVEYRSRS
jgi:uncharacterized spore protein YtfJ